MKGPSQLRGLFWVWSEPHQRMDLGEGASRPPHGGMLSGIASQSLTHRWVRARDACTAFGEWLKCGIKAAGRRTSPARSGGMVIWLMLCASELSKSLAGIKWLPKQLITIPRAGDVLCCMSSLGGYTVFIH